MVTADVKCGGSPFNLMLLLSEDTLMKLSDDPPNSPEPCSCPKGSMIFKEHIPQDELKEMAKRRAKELQQHKVRTTSVLSELLFAAPNSPLRYPIQGFTVQPLIATSIPGTPSTKYRSDSVFVTLTVSKGVLTTEMPSEGIMIEGDGRSKLIIEANSLIKLNYMLARVSYTSKIYHIHTGDLVYFKFEKHEAVFPITIKQPQLPVLYDMGTDINSHVTITTKTFLRYPNLNTLIRSIRSFYSNIKIIIADDSFEPQKITGNNIQHYIMPPAQGWFAGRNLAISQVTTKYFLWVDDDFLFTEDTKIEKLVETMEAVPELDVLGGTVKGNQFYFTLEYEEGEEMEGGCLNRKSNGKFQPLPGYPNCALASGVVNFFLARTDAVQRVGFDPKLQRVAHSEFFMDGLGSLMVASCNHVSIGHQPHSSNKDTARYSQFRHPAKSDQDFKLRLHFFKNYLKCVHYG
ncbi:beta-1%2C4 N-acetylgalactosaminyltransferase 2-like [Xyrichtys novacula]|uniref:Beta-1,4 N-acetylgalactosaminyltransferase 2-like n=1 Tax=Xyrichtys novacula TaxID=13765 RepID=A0AAV1GVC1_XYRNO|nr:beta-1%2C4 N-acetylgalactosaminyltransferase 2-like [Xyrichtys novacula]